MSEATEFARQKGGRFPLCQRVETLGAALGDGEGAAGVVLLGDASHCFPPDSAQGVNAALEDVAVLSSIVDETGGDKGMGGVAAAYAERRGPDVEALLKLAPALKFCRGEPFKEEHWVQLFRKLKMPKKLAHI